MTNRSQQGWIVLLFNLPRAKASVRVEVWRRLKRSGAVLLPSGGHVLPDSADTREPFEWLAESVRRNGGAASVLSVSEVDDLPEAKLRALFSAARADDYAGIIAATKKAGKSEMERRAFATRLERRLAEVMEIDFFGGSMRTKAAAAVRSIASVKDSGGVAIRKAVGKRSYNGRVWMTRPRPGIDRCSSAWLIRNLVDTRARFKFAKDASKAGNAIPFDMYNAPTGFGHVGDHCTFETLVAEFKLEGKQLRVLAEMIHDADIKDEKYGRTEAITVDHILKAWAASGIDDDELLRRGMELIDGLYRSIS